MNEPIRSEPIFKIPALIMLFLGILILIHLWFTLYVEETVDVVLTYGFIPLRVSAFFIDAGWQGALERVLSTPIMSSVKKEVAIYLQSQPTPSLTTLITYAFLHGSWMHLIMNGVWILAFGTPVVRRLGNARTLVLMVLTAVVGALFQTLFKPWDVMPMIGASAIASGLTAAAVRFAFTFEHRSSPHTAPVQTLWEVCKNRQALVFIVFWFITNFVFGAFSQTLGFTDGPVAWEAHIGGFLAGFILIGWLKAPSQS
jgi:membrane associated rhomboid family serine protease